MYVCLCVSMPRRETGSERKAVEASSAQPPTHNLKRKLCHFHMHETSTHARTHTHAHAHTQTHCPHALPATITCLKKYTSVPGPHGVSSLAMEHLSSLGAVCVSVCVFVCMCVCVCCDEGERKNK